MENIKNLKVYKKIEDFVKKNPVVTAMAALTVVVSIVAVSIPHDTGIINTSPIIPIVETREPIPRETATPTPKKSSNSGGHTVLINSGIRLRLEPSSDSEYIMTTLGGVAASLVGISDDYALVKYTDYAKDHTRLGYVPCDSISLFSSDVSPIASLDTCYVRFNKDGARIRNEMDENPNARNILINSKKGDYAKVLGVVSSSDLEKEDWYIVTYENFIGYMHGRNGEFISKEEMQTILDTEERLIKINGTNVNFRKTPSKGNNVIMTLNKNDIVKVIAADSDWYYVEFNGVQGYLSKELTCIEEYTDKITPKGLEHLHFVQNSDVKTRN